MRMILRSAATLMAICRAGSRPARRPGGSSHRASRRIAACQATLVCGNPRSRGSRITHESG
jgi:hypothetical protein